MANKQHFLYFAATNDERFLAHHGRGIFLVQFTPMGLKALRDAQAILQDSPVKKVIVLMGELSGSKVFYVQHPVTKPNKMELGALCGLFDTVIDDTTATWNTFPPTMANVLHSYCRMPANHFRISDESRFHVYDTGKVELEATIGRRDVWVDGSCNISTTPTVALTEVVANTKPFTVVGTLAENTESQAFYHVMALHKGDAIQQAQDQCRDNLVADGSLELDENPDNWEPEEQEPLDVAAVFAGHLEPL